MTDPTKRTWPLAVTEDPLFKGKATTGEVSASVGKTFVGCGYMMCKELGFHGMNRPIPADESRITSLAVGGRGRIRGTTSGERVHVFVYCRRPSEDLVMDVGVIPGAKEARGTVVAWTRDTCFVGVSPAPGNIYKCSQGGAGGCIQEWVHGYGTITEFASPVPDEGIACLVGDKDQNCLYGLTDRTGTFFIVEVEDGGKDVGLKAKEVEIVGPVDEIQHFSRTLIVTTGGTVYGAGAAGRLFSYSPFFTTGIERLDVSIPAIAGKQMYARIDSWTRDPFTGLIYGGTAHDGLLFQFNPNQGTMKSLGKPTNETRLRAITVGNDGTVYGISGEENSLGHFFTYDPMDGSLDDLGIPIAMTEIRRYGYEFDAAVTGPDGEIYLGEGDRCGCLFIYFPGIPKRRRPELEE